MKKKILCMTVCTAVWGSCLMFSAVMARDCPAIQAAAAAHAENENGETGLANENGVFHYYESGQPVTERWVTVEGATYYFGKDGTASVLKCRIDGDYYIFDKEGRLLQPSGKKVVRVETPDGGFQTYYINTDGKAFSGWSADKKYYFDKTCEPVTGITVIKGKFYSFSKSGRLKQNKTQKIRRAAKYEKPFSSLKKYIGDPKKASYYESCYGPGQDGVLRYGSFKVYTFKPDHGAEIFMGAE